MRPAFLSAILAAAASVAAANGSERPLVLRVGYFPNVTHAQGVIGAQGTREGGGWFERELGPGVTLQWFAFNAGPSAMEAILAGSLDLTYVGPNPALNAYIRSRGAEIRMLSGAAEGGAALVVRQDAGISSDADFRGRRIATPQLGNTQDVAARAHFRRAGFRVTQTGGDVLIVPTPNPEQVSLFQTGRVDAVWTVEPWVSRLVQDAGGRIYLEQGDVITTVLVARANFLRDHPAAAAAFRRAHGALTAWLLEHPAEAKELVRAGLSAEVRRELPAPLIEAAWGRLRFTSEIREEQMAGLVRDAQEAGFLRDAIPLDRLFSQLP